MKRKRILKLLILSSAVLTSGLIVGELQDNITVSKADGGGSVISTDGLTKTFTPTSSTVAKIDKNSFYYDATDGIYFQALASSWSPSNKFQKMNIYIEVPRNATGTAYVKANGNNSSRFMHFLKNGVIDSTSSFAYDKGENGNAFTTDDLSVFTIENEEKYFIGFTADGSDFKVDYFKITLTTGSFFGTPKYDINYYSSDGTEAYTSLTEQVWENENPLVNPTLPNETGKVFLGWSDVINGTNIVDPTTYTVTANLNFYAVWQDVVTYTVTFNDYEGAEPRLVAMNEGPLTGLEDPTPREGSEFLGWYTTSTFDEGSEVTKETILSSDLTLYAKWQEATYVFVSFVVDGQEVNNIRTIQGHELDTWPENPTMNGMVFVGWFDENDVEYTRISTFDSTTTLVAKFEIVPVHMYNFSDAQYASIIPTSITERVKIDDAVSIIDFNKKSGKAGTIDTINFTDSMQAKGVEVTLKYNAEVTVYLAQTGKNKTRKIAVIDNDGFLHTTDLEPSSTAGAQVINLEAGTYKLFAFDYSSYDYSNPMYNFYGVKIDYTNKDTIVSDLAMTEAVKLSNQAGYDANHNESMRFVGEIDFATVSEIASIRVDITSSKLIDGLPVTEAIANDYIYTVYDRVTLTDGAKYDFHDNRIYFYYIVDGLNDTFGTLTCEASIALTNGKTYKVSSTFDYNVAFAK